MEYLFRKRKLVKTLLSLSLLLAMVAVIQRLTLGAGDVQESLSSHRINSIWLEAENNFYKSSNNGNQSSGRPQGEGPALGLGLGLGGDLVLSPNSSTPSSWDIRTTNCSENWDVRQMDWFQSLDLRFQQYVLYRHCRYFPMILNHPEKCSGQVDLLIVVKSVIEQHDRRDAIRKTWGREQLLRGKAVRTVFLLGTPSIGKDHKNLQKLLEYEDQLFGDLLQWDFMDTFFNLTLKEVNFLKWFDIYCPRTHFIFKGDDDVFVNTENVLEFLSTQSQRPGPSNLFAGDIISRALPIRNHQSKYFIPKQLYDKPYPSYAGGGGFLMSSHLAKRLFAVSESIQLYPIDDVYLGMCLQKIRVDPQLHLAFRTFGIVKRKVSPMNADPCFYKNLLVIHKLSPAGLLQMWDTVHNSTLVCAKRVVIEANL